MPNLNDIMRKRMVEGHALGAASQAQRRPRGIIREYQCDTRTHARYLSNALLEMSERTYHPARVTIDGTLVLYETWTPNAGVTHLDEEYCNEADILYEDTRFWR